MATAQRVISFWGILPEEVMTAPTVNSFKSRLNAGWANSFALYNPNFGELRCMLGMYL